jgi:hypothetical protein
MYANFSALRLAVFASSMKKGSETTSASSPESTRFYSHRAPNHHYKLRLWSNRENLSIDNAIIIPRLAGEPLADGTRQYLRLQFLVSEFTIFFLLNPKQHQVFLSLLEVANI